MGLTLITAPSSEPITLSQAKVFLRVEPTEDDDDDLITAAIAAAREAFEKDTGRQLVTATYEQTFDAFAPELRLRRPPLATVAEVRYADTESTEAVLATSVYEVVTSRQPGLVRTKPGQFWPSPYSRPDAVTVKFTAGQTVAAVPELIKMALRQYIALLYENRQPVVVGAGNVTTVEVPECWGAIVARYDMRGAG